MKTGTHSSGRSINEIHCYSSQVTNSPCNSSRSAKCLVADVGNVSCRSLPAWNNAAAHSLDFGGSEKRISNFHSLSFSSLCPSVRPSVRPSCHHITDGLQRRRIHISSRRRTGRTRTTKSSRAASDPDAQDPKVRSFALLTVNQESHVLKMRI